MTDKKEQSKGKWSEETMFVNVLTKWQ